MAGHYGDKSNNFTALRLLLALVVLVGHAYPISGNGTDPLSEVLIPYAWIGSIAVAGFFAISGLLVTASFQSRGPVFYAASRALRLYPAVIAYSVFAILVIGPLAAQVPLSQYFDANPWGNMKNALLWTWDRNLPYAFVDHPLSGSSNGSAWTLPVELRCYLLVLLVGFFGVLDKRARANVALLALLYLCYQPLGEWALFGDSERVAEPLRFFLVGALFWVNRAWVPLSWLGAVAAAILLYLSARYDTLYLQVFPVTVTYLLFVVAFRTPAFDIDRYGDISYGVYLYAWPIQQLVWQPGQTALGNIALSLPIVLVLAYASWRLVEKPAMGLRRFLRRAPARHEPGAAGPVTPEPAMAPTGVIPAVLPEQAAAISPCDRGA